MLDSLLNVNSAVVCLVVGALVFAEDALFVGFVIPGETAAILGGVAASQGHLSLALVMAVVVLAAIAGDSVGYEVGRGFLGPKVLESKRFARHRHRLDDARDLLARRGGWAVFLGRFIAFFRAVMPALAGSARMPYRRFLTFNAFGGVVWGVGAVLLGYLAGSSYEHIAKVAGRDSAVVVAAVVVAGLVVWQVRRRRVERATEDDAARDDGEADPTRPT